MALNDDLTVKFLVLIKLNSPTSARLNVCENVFVQKIPLAVGEGFQNMKSLGHETIQSFFLLGVQRGGGPRSGY